MTDHTIHMDEDVFEVEILLGDVQDSSARWAVCTLFVWKKFSRLFYCKMSTDSCK